MSADFLSLAVLLSSCVCLAVGTVIKDDMHEVISRQGANCTLRCTAKPKQGVAYMAIRWYKCGENPSPRLSGLLTRDLPNGTTRWYAGVEQEVELLGESYSILLTNVTCRDSGVYMCHLAAPVGEQNRNGEVLLSLTDCPVEPTESEMTKSDACLVIFATAVLIVALLIFLVSYACLKNTLWEQTKATKKETLIEASLKPLDKKD